MTYISLPFIANMPSDVDIFVNFTVSARINKDKIELIGKSKPARDRKGGRIGLKLERFDLPPYLGYLPFDPVFKLKSGKFSDDLDIVFAKSDIVSRQIAIDRISLKNPRVVLDRNAAVQSCDNKRYVADGNAGIVDGQWRTFAVYGSRHAKPVRITASGFELNVVKLSLDMTSRYCLPTKSFLPEHKCR